LLLTAREYVPSGSGTTNTQKTQNNTYTHSKQYTAHKITNTITQNYKYNAHKITNIMFHPNKEPK
jgi:hypothetical protein